MYKIEKDIPIPESEMTYPFGKMKKGDSFFIKCVDDDLLKMRNIIANHSRNFRHSSTKDWLFTVRKVKGGVRVWRKS